MEAEIAKYGIGGIAIGLIGVIILLIKYYHKLVTNRINHNTEAITRNTEVMVGLENVIKNSCDAIRDLKDEIKCLRQLRR